MAILKNVLLAILALLIQTVFVQRVSVFGIRPDLVLLVVVYVGTSRGHVEATLIGLLSGLAQDAYNPSYMGLNAFAKSIVGFGCGYAHGVLAVERPGVRASLLFVAALAHDVLYFLAYTAGQLPKFASLLLRQGIGAAVYTTLFGLAVTSLVHLRPRARSR